MPGKLWSMAVPPSILRLASAQLGVIARRQVIARIGQQKADALLQSSWVEREFFGVYRFRGGARLPVQRAMAATLRAGPGATLTGPAALSLLDLDGFGAFNQDLPFEVLIPPGRRPRGLNFPHRRDPDPDRPVGHRGEVRVAGPVDALIDAARFVDEVGERRLRLAYDVMRWRGLLQEGRLSARIHGLGDRAPGGSTLMTLLDLDRQAATGDGERRLGTILQRFDPPPEPQVWVTPSRRVDWWFATVRYGWEYQGRVDHATPAGRLRDDARDRELRRDGIRIGYLTATDLDDEVALLGTVAGALTTRAHQLGVAPPVLRASEEVTC
jgi:hypothetical protein